MNSISHAAKFRKALETNAAAYGVTLTAEAVEGLANYYEILNLWNSRLHLVAPSSPIVFATRHILESLVLLEYLPIGARIADVGSGGGRPMIPCLIARPDLEAVLIEASGKKAVFLREALGKTSTSKRATVIADRFENVVAPDVGFVTCRALEHFKKMLPELLQWAPPTTTFLLFGGEGLRKEIENAGFTIMPTLLPNSERRFLFVVTKAE